MEITCLLSLVTSNASFLQLTVYNYMDGPCYRCLYPTPPPDTVTNCSEGGVLGVGECDVCSFLLCSVGT